MSKTKFSYTAKRGIANDGTELALVGINDGGRSIPINLISDSGFDTGKGWTISAVWTIENGYAKNYVGNSQTISQTITLETGKYYRFTVDVIEVLTGSVSATYTAGTASYTDISSNNTLSTTGILERKLLCTSGGTHTFNIRANTGFAGKIDNASCYEMNGETIGNDASDVYPTGNAASLTGEANSVGVYTAYNNAVLSSVASPVYSGTYAVSAESNTTPTGAAGISFPLSTYCTDGISYELKLYARHNGTGGEWDLFITNGPSLGASYRNVCALFNTDTTYTEYKIYFKYSSTFAYLIAREVNASNDGGVYIDAITIRPTNQLLENTGFNTEVSGGVAWTKGTGWTISGGLAVATAATSNLTQTVTVDVAGTYEIAVDCVTYTSGSFSLSPTGGTAIYTKESNVVLNTSSTRYFQKIYVHSPGTITLRIVASSGTATFDNFSCWLIEDDQSAANDNGFEVHGQLRYLQVAPGADLRAWEGFSATNYIEQPYTSALDFGTGNFSICFWLKANNNGSYQLLFSRGYYATAWSGSVIRFYTHISNNTLWFTVSDDGQTTVDAIESVTMVCDNQWHFCCGLKNGSTYYLYIDSVLEKTGAVIQAAASLDNPNAVTQIGRQQQPIQYPATNSQVNGLKIYNTALTASQIKTIYDKEKVLFENYAAYQKVGDEYNIEFVAQEKTQSNQTTKDINIALDGTVESLVHRTDNYHEIVSDLIPFNNISPYRELIYSVRGDEIFTCNLGAGVIPSSNIDVSMEDTQITEQREGTSTFIRLRFRLRER